MSNLVVHIEIRFRGNKYFVGSMFQSSYDTGETSRDQGARKVQKVERSEMSLQKRGRFLCFPSCFRGLRKCGDVTWRYRLSSDVAKGLYSLCDNPHHLSSHYTLGAVFHMAYIQPVRLVVLSVLLLQRVHRSYA